MKNLPQNLYYINNLRTNEKTKSLYDAYKNNRIEDGPTEAYQKKLDKFIASKQKSHRPVPKNIVCSICHSVNNHFTDDCPHAICKICYGIHLTSKCPEKDKCQICGSKEHITKYCNSNLAILMRVEKYSKCGLCGRLGHTANNCYAKRYNNNNTNNYNNVNYTRGRGRGKYRGQGRGGKFISRGRGKYKY